MPALRDHLGSTCPSCRNDILQAVPSTNRMPNDPEALWCHSCKTRMTMDDLKRGRSASGVLSRLFGRPQRS